jgi:hypothetical protein
MVQLGTTKHVGVARVILESIFKNNELASFAASFKQVDWNDYRAINDTFKQLIKRLEILYR